MSWRIQFRILVHWNSFFMVKGRRLTVRDRNESVGRTPRTQSCIYAAADAQRLGRISRSDWFGETATSLKKFLSTKKDGLLYLNDPLGYSIEHSELEQPDRERSTWVGGPRVGGRRQATDSVLGEIWMKFLLYSVGRIWPANGDFPWPKPTWWIEIRNLGLEQLKPTDLRHKYFRHLLGVKCCIPSG